MALGNFPKVTVICMVCGTIAPYTAPDTSNPYGIFHWHQPCQKCGSEQWGAHDIDRDWQTGRLLVPEKKK